MATITEDAPPPPGGGGVAELEAHKEAGNKAFAEGHFIAAVAAYTAALAAVPSPPPPGAGTAVAAVLSNRAAANLKLENYGDVIADADAALAADGAYTKAYYRKGSALLVLGRFKRAKACFATVLKLKPGDKDAAAKLEDAEKQAKRAAFEAAIATEAGAPPSQTLDPNAVAVDAATYKGRHLPPFPGATDGFSVRSALLPPGGLSAAAAARPPAVAPEALAGAPELVNENGLSHAFVTGIMADFKAQRLVHKKYVIELLLRARRHLASQPAVVSVPWPAGARAFNVCGDTHGQYYDTVNIFEAQAGLPSPANPFVFNGDFVDRGSWSVENVLLLFAWQLLYPRSVFLTRGNHETRNMNRMYGFDGEVKAKYDASLVDLFSEVFCALPLGVVIDKRVLIVHGGLPTVDGVSVDGDLAHIDRFREPPESGLMSDVLWSDPQPFPGRGPSKRGVGKSFGPNITAAFLKANGLELLIRSHEVREEGYLVEHDGKCITVFSAPNYCDQMGNKGGVVRLVRRAGPGAPPLPAGPPPGGDDGYTLAHPEFVSFDAVPHPPVRPMAYATGMMGGYGF